MDKRPKWRRLFPNWRCWLSPAAIASIVSGVYWVVIGVTGIAAGISEGFAWQFLAFGLFLSLLTWWSIAYSNSEADRKESEAREREAKLHQRLDELPDRVLERSTEFKSQLAMALQERDAARGDANAVRQANEHITELFNTVIDSLERTVTNDVAGIESIVGIKETLSNAALTPEERITEASGQATAYYGKRASGRIVFVGDADLLRKQLEQSSESLPPKESADT